jgi:hypothetical protein
VDLVSGDKDKYEVDEAFADALAVACASNPKLWGRLGKELDPGCMPGDFAPLVLKAIRAIAHDVGHGPTSALVVFQRLRRWVGEGTVTHEQLDDVCDHFDEVIDDGLPDVESLAQEIIPILKRRMERAALDKGFSAFQKRRDLDDAVGMIQRAQRLGDVDSDLGTLLGPSSFEEMDRLKRIERLPTGVLELDDAIGGGPYRGTLSVFMADTGGGKSIALIQVACEAAMQGHHVCLATLELPKAIILARIKANLTGIPIDAVLADPEGSGCIERLAEIQDDGGFGSIMVKDFSPSTTTIPDITNWVREWEEEKDVEVTLLVVDYADKCVSHEKKRDDNSYNTGKVVYEGLRLWAANEGGMARWTWTASADKGQSRDKKVKKTDTGDVADSKHKVRVSDLWITLNPREETDDGNAMLAWFIAKNRLGRARFTVGPLPTDWECARIVSESRWEE